MGCRGNKSGCFFHFLSFFCVHLFCLGGLKWYFCIKCAANWHFGLTLSSLSDPALWHADKLENWSATRILSLHFRLLDLQVLLWMDASSQGSTLKPQIIKLNVGKKCLPTLHHLWSLKMRNIKCQHRTGFEKAYRMRCVMCVSAQPEPTVLSLFLTETLTAGSMSPHSLFTTVTGMWGSELVLFNSPWMWIIFEKKSEKKRLFFAH